MKLKTKFQDEDFELGEVVDAKISTTSLVDTHIEVKCKAKKGGEYLFCFESIKEFTEWFEDYEEPKWFRDYWFIDSCGSIIKQEDDVLGSTRREIGNYFETKEEAETAVEKLKAWKRLKESGAYYGWRRNQTGTCEVYMRWPDRIPSYEVKKDLDLLFGGEE